MNTNTVSDDRTKQQIERALGSVVVSALNNPVVTDIILNEDCSLWIEELGQPMRRAGTLKPVDAMTAINAIASFQQLVINYAQPIMSTVLPIDLGSRFEANIPPTVRNPTFAIRKKALKIFTLENYQADQVITARQKELIETAITKRKNIIVVGSTGSGKTTLTNAIINAIPRGDRLYIIEDTVEIQVSAENYTCKMITPHASALQLLASALRQKPDRILVGEVRGAEAWTLLKVWNTGHPGGICTLHADSNAVETGNYAAALKRLFQLCSENADCPQNSEIICDNIASTVDLIIYITKTNKGRRVPALVEVHGYDRNTHKFDLTPILGDNAEGKE